MTEEQEEGSKKWIVKVRVLHEKLEDVLNQLHETHHIDRLLDCPGPGSSMSTVVAKRRKTNEEILDEMKKKALRDHEIIPFLQNIRIEKRRNAQDNSKE